MSAQSDTPPPPPPPPGWYPDATHGGQRYWTGAGWGVHESEMPPMPTHQRPPTQSVHPGAAGAPATAGPKPSDNTVSAGYALAILISPVGLVIGLYLLATNRASSGVGVIMTALATMAILTLVSLGVAPT